MEIGMENLPPELVLTIVDTMEVQDQVSMYNTSKWLRYILNDNRRWYGYIDKMFRSYIKILPVSLPTIASVSYKLWYDWESNTFGIKVNDYYYAHVLEVLDENNMNHTEDILHRRAFTVVLKCEKCDYKKHTLFSLEELGGVTILPAIGGALYKNTIYKLILKRCGMRGYKYECTDDFHDVSIVPYNNIVEQLVDESIIIDDLHY